jgi:hypothetical protein
VSVTPYASASWRALMIVPAQRATSASRARAATPRATYVGVEHLLRASWVGNGPGQFFTVTIDGTTNEAADAC